MANREIIGRAWREFEPHLHEQGYELVEIEFAQQGRQRILRIYIDRPGRSITLDDCVAASQLLSALLDAGAFLDQQYVLEVSSPGIDRPLRKAGDFDRFTGEAIRLVTHDPVQGRRKFSGTLKGFGDGLVTVECGGQDFEIHIENLKKANLDR